MRRQVEETVSHERIYQHMYADHRRGPACTSTCASAERSAESDWDGRKRLGRRIDAEEYRTASALKNVRRLWRSAFIMEAGKSIWLKDAGPGGFMLNLVERKCGHLLTHPLGSKKADTVTTAIIVELCRLLARSVA
tara:strand:+ start:105 stop:512 length:408 start_codon:yes stop_codon:yes gene_type:complete